MLEAFVGDMPSIGAFLVKILNIFCCVYLMLDMKRQECLTSIHSLESNKLYVAAETAENGNIGAGIMTMQPPPKSCRVGVSYFSESHTGTQPKSKDYCSQNGISDQVDRPRLESCLSEGEQVNVFSVDEVIRFTCIM